MTDVRKLLDEATPLPWRVWQPSREPDETRYQGRAWVGPTHQWSGGFAATTAYERQDADAALIVHAVNHLPDYEAAVDALETALYAWRNRFPGYGRPEWYDEARAVLRRLRGEG